MGHDGHLNAEDRRGDRRAEQRLVALVIRVGHQRHTRRQQLRTGGLDEDPLVAVVETDPVVGTGPFPVLELSLRHGRAERDVPQRRRLRLVGLAAGQVMQEGTLGDGPGAGVDRLIRVVPVHGQAKPAPQILERLLVLLGEPLAEFHEVAPRDRHLRLPARLHLQVGVVVHRRFAPHPEVVLHPALGGQAVVIPAHRVEDLQAPHPLVAGDAVGVGVAENVPDVQ